MQDFFFSAPFYWWCSINLLWYDYISSGGSGDPAGTALPACGAPATLWMVGNGCAERARISSYRKSRLREPKTTGRQREAITFVLTFLISTVQKWVTAAKDTSNITESSESVESLMGLLQHAVNTALPFQSRQCFSAEELKSFLAFPHFPTHLWWLIASRFSQADTARVFFFFFVCCRACLGEIKGYFGLNTSPLCSPPLAM